MSKKIHIIGAGISSLACASFLAKAGHSVCILEKNATIGGRARKFESDGFVFDMGPSWYWMPEVFENFYKQFGKKASDFYDLIRLSPSYRVFWEDQTNDDIPANLDDMYAWFEKLEPGSADQLKRFLKDARYKYKVGMEDFVFKPSLSWKEFIDLRVFKGVVHLNMLQSHAKFIRKYFKHPKILQLLEFPILFLGDVPERTPAMYSLMNYADIALGTWYPQGGMFGIIEAFESIAREQGVEIKCNQDVQSFEYEGDKIVAIHTKTDRFETDMLVSGADYHHTDLKINAQKSSYTEAYWDKRSMAPSSLLFYLGINKKVDGLLHHNLFFDESFQQHAEEIYTQPSWPTKPLFYACCPSKTDPSVAPEGSENVFLLVPLASDLEDTEEIREKYYTILMDRLEAKCGQSIREHVTYKRSFCITDFKQDYNAYKGNAYGLANTLKQTAFLKPSLRSKNVSNLFFTGQLTVPGPGVPPSIISGEIVAKEVDKELKKNRLKTAKL